MKGNIIVTGALALSLGGGAQALAQEDGQDGVVLLDTITVTTPLRRESPLARSTSSVTVIGEEQIRRSVASDLPSLLRSLAGVSIVSNGGRGSQTGLSLRGTRPVQTLVLINGVSARSATSGETSVFNIPLEAIERIEIAKGAHSAQYGSDAIGGVVNIITKSGGACDNGQAVCTTLTAGVSHPWGGHAGAEVRGTTPDGTRFALGGRLTGTRGYDFTLWPVELDDDGFLQGSLNFSLSKEFDWGEIYADGLYSRARSEYDNQWGPENQADTDTFAGKLGARFDHGDDWTSTVELVSGVDRSRNFAPGGPVSASFDTARLGGFASTQKTFATGKASHIVNVGGEVHREQVRSTTLYDETARTRAAAFAQYTLELGALTVDAGLRHDDDSQFGGATTYNLGASYEVVPGLTVYASHGTGFRAPTFNDLYFPGGWANPNLLPERSRSVEAGLRWNPDERTTFEAAVYRTLLTDAIALDAMWIPQNIDRVRINGFEASLSHRFDDRWLGRVSVDVRDPRNRATGLVMARQERFKIAAELEFKATEKLDLTARVQHVASRFDDAANTVPLSAYTVVDFGAIYAFDAQSQLKLSVENLFNTRYSTADGYRAPGRTFNVSFSRTF